MKKPLVLALALAAPLTNTEVARANPLTDHATDARINLNAAIKSERLARKEVEELRDRLKALETAEKALEHLNAATPPPPVEVEVFRRNWAAAEGTGTFDLSRDDARQQATDAARALRTALETMKTEAEAKHAEEAKNRATAEDEYREALGKLADTTEKSKSLPAALMGATTFRCKMALCWGGKGAKYAIEPVLDLPFSLTWSMGDGALPGYINSHVVNLEFNAGLRFWFAYDIASVAVFVSEPVIKSGDPILVDGSSFAHGSGSIHRSFPSVGFGFFGDALLLGVSYDVLRNGAADQNQDRNFPPNEVLSRSLTFSLGFSFLNLTRNQIGKAK